MPSRLLHSTPALDGFHMPAEWEPHDGCYLVWPERTDNWRSGAGPAQAAFTTVAETIAAHEPVTVLTSAGQWERARAACAEGIRVVETANDDAWVRDTGPTFVVNRSLGERRGVDWVFNARGGRHGGLYAPWTADDLVAAKVCELEGVARYRAPFVLEGGSVHVDGEGTCLTTEECLLNPNRNPGLSRHDIEGLLRSYLGVETVIWIPTRRRERRDRRARRQPGLLHPSRSGAVDLDRGGRRSADGDLAPGPAGAGIGHRRAGPSPRRRSPAGAGALPPHRRGGGRVEPRQRARPRRAGDRLAAW